MTGDFFTMSQIFAELLSQSRSERFFENDLAGHDRICSHTSVHVRLTRPGLEEMCQADITKSLMFSNKYLYSNEFQLIGFLM
jgi:hypothetical protein